MQPIAHIESPFKEKFGIPRQSCLVPVVSRIVFEPLYRDIQALRGLDEFTYIWLIWDFSQNGPRWEPTVRPPRLGGNKRMGVWATRSTFRPNPLGLSSVKISRIYSDSIHGPVIEVEGADLMDGTPIYDIKPYITYADSHPDARCGWVDDIDDRKLDVIWDCEPAEETDRICAVLAEDPRPSYLDDPNRVYGMNYGEYNVSFTVDGSTVRVIRAEKISTCK